MWCVFFLFKQKCGCIGVVLHCCVCASRSWHITMEVDNSEITYMIYSSPPRLHFFFVILIRHNFRVLTLKYCNSVLCLCGASVFRSFSYKSCRHCMIRLCAIFRPQIAQFSWILLAFHLVTSVTHCNSRLLSSGEIWQQECRVFILARAVSTVLFVIFSNFFGCLSYSFSPFGNASRSGIRRNFVITCSPKFYPRI